MFQQRECECFSVDLMPAYRGQSSLQWSRKTAHTKCKVMAGELKRQPDCKVSTKSWKVRRGWGRIWKNICVSTLFFFQKAAFPECTWWNKHGTFQTDYFHIMRLCVESLIEKPQTLCTLIQLKSALGICASGGIMGCPLIAIFVIQSTASQYAVVSLRGLTFAFLDTVNK